MTANPWIEYALGKYGAPDPEILKMGPTPEVLKLMERQSDPNNFAVPTDPRWRNPLSSNVQPAVPQGYNPAWAAPSQQSRRTGNPFITTPSYFPTFERRLQPDREAGNAMSDYKNALDVKGQLAETVRRATAQAQTADAQRKMQLFQTMSPDELDRIYSGAPQSDEEAEIQRTIAGYENAGNAGFQLGWNSDRRALNDSRITAQFDRSIRDSDQAFRARNDQADRAEIDLQLRQDEAERKLNEGVSKYDLQKQKFDSQKAAREAKIQQGIFSDAYNAVLDGAITSDKDINRLFPSLDMAQKETLSGYLRARQAEDNKYFGDVSGKAASWEEQLRPLREKADEAAAATAKNTKSEPGFSYYLNPFHYTNPTASLANWAAKNPQAPSGPRGLTPAENDLIQRAEKITGGAVVYDPATRTFIPSQSNRASAAEQSPFYTSQVSGASPDRPIATTTTGNYGPQAPVNPLLGYFDTLQRSGAAPVDKEVALLTKRFPRVSEGASMNNGQFVFTGGRWVRRR